MCICGFSDCLYCACHCLNLSYMRLEGELAMNSDSQFSMQFFTSVTYVCVIKPSKSEQSLKFSFFPLPFPKKIYFCTPNTKPANATWQIIAWFPKTDVTWWISSICSIYIYITDTQCFTESRRLFQLSYIAKLCAFAHGFFASMYRSLAVKQSRRQQINE